jgi:hypothetical protein
MPSAMSPSPPPSRPGGALAAVVAALLWVSAAASLWTWHTLTQRRTVAGRFPSAVDFDTLAQADHRAAQAIGWELWLAVLTAVALMIWINRTARNRITPDGGHRLLMAGWAASWVIGSASFVLMPRPQYAFDLLDRLDTQVTWARTSALAFLIAAAIGSVTLRAIRGRGAGSTTPLVVMETPTVMITESLRNKKHYRCDGHASRLFSPVHRNPPEKYRLISRITTRTLTLGRCV